MNPRPVRSCLAILAAALPLVGAALPAQQARLRVWLTEAVGINGPATWRMVRDTVLPRLPDWPRGLDPRRALRIEIDWPYQLRVAVRPREGSDNQPSANAARYFQAELQLPGVGTLKGLGDFAGGETWHLAAPTHPSGRIRNVLLLANVEAGSSVELDAARWFAALLGAARTEPTQPWQEALLTLLSSQCGTLHLSHRAASPNAGATSPGLQLQSPKGQGGILLPFLGALLIDHLRRPGAGDLTGGPEVPAFERNRVLALAGLGPARAEAARQLGRSQNGRAQPILEGLLSSRDDSRLAAMQALAQLGSVGSAVQILAAASPRLPNSEQIAEASVRQLWRGASATQRDGLRQQLPSLLLAALQQPAVPTSAAPAPAGESKPTNPPPLRQAQTFAGWNLVLLGLLSVIVTLLGLLCRQGWRIGPS